MKKILYRIKLRYHSIWLRFNWKHPDGDKWQDHFNSWNHYMMLLGR